MLDLKVTIEELAADLSGSERALFRELAARAESATARQELIVAAGKAPGDKLASKLATLAQRVNFDLDEAVDAPRRQAAEEAATAASAKWRAEDRALRERRRTLAALVSNEGASRLAREAAAAELQNLPREARYEPPPPEAA